MKKERDALFAASGFALNEYRRVAGRGLLCAFEKLEHDGRFGYNLAGRTGGQNALELLFRRAQNRLCGAQVRDHQAESGCAVPMAGTDGQGDRD